MGSDESSRNRAPLPWKTRLMIAGLSIAADCCRRSNGTVNRSLMKLLDIKSPASGKPLAGVSSSDHTIDPSRNLWFRLFVPTTTTHDTPVPVIVYFHGGGFIYFGADSKPFDDICRRLAGEIPSVVVSINYRLAPEHRYPAAFDDGLDALKFIDETGNILPPNADLTRCFIAGDSAGGNMAHHVTLRALGLDFKKVKLKGVIALQPYYGGEERTESELRLTKVPFVSTERTDWSWRAFLPVGSDRDHEVVNVLGGPNSRKNEEMLSAVRFPATAMVVGGLDPLQDWQRRHVDGLKRCGKEAYLVEYPNSFHGFYIFPELPESSQLIAEIRNFIQKQSA